MSRAIIFITGMSGAGKSTILDQLSIRGYQTIDTDYNQLSKQVFNHGESEWIWDKEKVEKVINEHLEGALFISGTVSNQGKFYSHFNEILYFKAPVNVLLERVQHRTSNHYGKTHSERKEIIQNFEQFESIIEAGSTRTIDTTREIKSIVDEVEAIAQRYLLGESVK